MLAHPALDLIKLESADVDPLGPQPRYHVLKILGDSVVVYFLHAHLYERRGPILIGLAKFFFAPPPDIRPSRRLRSRS